MFHSVYHCFVVSDVVSQCLPMFHSVYHCFVVSDVVSQCLPMFHSVCHCFVVSDVVSQCLPMFHIVYHCNFIFNKQFHCLNFRQIPRFRSVGDCRNDALVVNLTFEAGLQSMHHSDSHLRI